MAVLSVRLDISGDTTVRVETSEMADLKARMHGSVAIVTGAYHERECPRGNLTNRVTI
jgi:hypothetical protein